MTEWITGGRFHESDDVDDWRVLANGVAADFRTESFATGVALIDAIGDLPTANHRPDVDLRSSGVTVRVMAVEVAGRWQLDLDLVRQVSAAARTLGVTADPTAVQDVQVTIDALNTLEVRSFWRAVLGYREVGDEDLLDVHGHGPPFWFQQMDGPRPQRNRLHIDVFVPHDQVEARVAAAMAAGGHLVTDEHAPSWWVVADPEGNEACISTWMGRD